MADGITIKVDSRRAVAKFDRVPVEVRNNLRRVLPDLTRALGRKVDEKLDRELKSRTNLQTKQELHETTKNQIYGVVSVVWAPGGSKAAVPLFLEEGTKPHEIAARNVSALSFFWEKLGQNVMFRRVMHPGFAGIHYMQRSFNEMKDQIVSELKDAAKTGARQVR